MKSLAFAPLIMLVAGCTDANPLATEALNQQFGQEAQARTDGDRSTLSSCAVWVQNAMDTSAKAIADEAALRERGDKNADANAQAMVMQAKQEIAAQIATVKAGITETHLIAPDGTDLGRFIGGTVAHHPKFGTVDFGVRWAVSFESANCTGQGYMTINGSSIPMLGIRRIGADSRIWDTTGPRRQIQAYSDLAYVNGRLSCGPRGGNGSALMSVPVSPSNDTATAYDLYDLTLTTIPIR